MGYFYIALTILFTVYGQLILKWKISKLGQLPEEVYAKFWFLVKMLMDPFIFSGFVSAFIASLFWMAAMTKFELSFAYPFMSLSFILVFVLSVLLFGEAITVGKIVGLALIVSGIIAVVRY